MAQRPRVLVTHAVDIGDLEQTCDVVRGAPGAAPDAEAILCGPMQVLTAAEVAAMPRLRVVAVSGAGTDGLDHTALAAAGVAVLTAAEATAPATADLAMTLMLMAARRVDDAQGLLRGGGWPTWAFDAPPARDVTGATLGLVGYGHIGRLMARRAAAFSMRVLHHTRTATGEPGWCATLEELLPQSDFLSVHVPLTPETRSLIGAEQLDLLPERAVVVNTARGGIVDETALCDRLDSGRLYAAGLDVFPDEPNVDPRLLRTPHLVLTPHIGSATVETRQAMVGSAIARLKEHLRT